MKKLLMMLMALMACITVSAQDEGEEEELDTTFDFCYADGTVIPNGSTLLFNGSVDPDDGTGAIHPPIFVKANTEEGGFVGISCEVVGMTNGMFKICFPMECISKVASDGDPDIYVDTEAGGAKADPNTGPLTSNDQPRDLETAWVNFEEYNTFKVDYQIQVYTRFDSKYGTSYMNVGSGSKITVVYNYADPAGISGVSDSRQAKVVSVHTADGQQVRTVGKGLNIVRYDNGKTVKVIGR